MNIKVLYHSSTGNTEKLANTIADELNIRAESIGDKPVTFSESVDLLFIGDGIYFGKAHKRTLAFIDSLSSDIVKNVAVFATYGGQVKIGFDIKKLLADKGLKVIGEPFMCKGQAWAVANRNRPNQDDLNEVREFAGNTVANLEYKSQ